MEVDGRENLRADRRVQLHLFELGRRQFPGLVQDVFGDAIFPVSCSSAAASIA
jgi:hypothetical protein